MVYSTATASSAIREATVQAIKVFFMYGKGQKRQIWIQPVALWYLFSVHLSYILGIGILVHR